MHGALFGAPAYSIIAPRRSSSAIFIGPCAPIAFKTADISVLSRGSALDRPNKDVDKRSDEILHVAPVSRGLAQTSHAEDERTAVCFRRHLQTRSAEALGDELDDEALEISIDLLNDGIRRSNRSAASGCAAARSRRDIPMTGRREAAYHADLSDAPPPHGCWPAFLVRPLDHRCKDGLLVRKQQIERRPRDFAALAMSPIVVRAKPYLQNTSVGRSTTR